MADATDPDASHDSSSSSDKEKSWYAHQWNVLCEELGTTDPAEVLARVQTMKREMKRIQGEEQSDEEEGLVTISEVEEVFREMNQKMEKLRERNAALVERMEEEGDEVDSPFRDLHQQAEELLDTLDAATMEEARERIQKLNQRLEDLYQEKEQLAQTGFSDASEAVDEIQQLREERDALRRERDRLQADRNQLEQQLEATAEPDASLSTELDDSMQDAAVIMRDMIGVSTPPEAEAFVQIVRQVHHRIQKRAAAHNVEIDEEPDDAVEMLRSITEHLDELPSPETLPAATANVLGVNTTSEARTLANTIRRVGTQIVEHYEESVEFENVDLDADDASTLLRTLEDQLRAVPDLNATTNGEGLPPEIGDVLGIRSLEDARELESLIADMSDQIERLNEDYEKLDEAGLTADEALAMIENMEVQLADLYHGSDGEQAASVGTTSGQDVTLDDALQSRIARLTDAAPETDDIMEVVRTLTDRVDRLSDEREMLAEAGLDVNEALTMIESMEAQLNDLYRLHDEETKTKEETEDGDVADRLAAIEDVLGISTREEAEELSQITRELEDQLTVLYQEKEKLEELGLSTIEDAVDMIKSMEEQLTELYEDKESLLDVQLGDTEDQSTFQQLEFLYAEREKMQQALGVSSADEVIEMVEGLNTQLDELYKGRDADVDPEERYNVLLWEPDAPDPSSEDSDLDEATPDDSGTDLTMNSMEHQLESLYREKETLLHHGFDDAQEAVSQLQMQQKQIDALQRENHTYEQRFERLQSEFGTAQVSQIVEVVEALESEADASLQEFLDPSFEAADTPEYGLDIEATSPFVDSETLDQLDEMSSSELDDLDAGVVCLSDDGTVQSLNEAAFQLPGLPPEKDRAAVVGKNFFSELAPSTNNNLFYGRFQKGQRRGEMSARFPYTFTSPDEGPKPFAVHLYRAADGETTWLLYRPT